MLTDVLGVVFVLIGVFFSTVGVVGMIRLPDVYTRIHASGKVATLGIFGLLIGAAFLQPESTLKLISIGLFLLVTSPVASHAIAAAAYRAGVPLALAERDDMAAEHSGR